MLVLCALVSFALSIALGILTIAGAIDYGDDGYGLFLLLAAMAALLASVLVYRYEVVTTARSGQTLGKRLMDICVIRLDPDGVVIEPPERDSSMVRWAIPHGAAVAATILSVVIIFATNIDGLTDREFLLVLALLGAFVAVAWSLCYVSALFDENRRGWHDKAAGTIVVVGGELQRVDSEDPDRSPPSGQDSTRRASGTAAPEAAPQGEESSYGLVSDYYAPVRRRPPPDRHDTQT